VVLANSAVAIQCFEQEKSIIDCQDIARESLKSGRAEKTLKHLIEKT